jgi:hypothetical protein
MLCVDKLRQPAIIERSDSRGSFPQLATGTDN